MASIVSIFINGAIVYPITRRILSANKSVPSFTKRKVLAALFLLLVGVLSNAVEISNMFNSKNAFRILNVPRTASEAEIRRAYKTLSLELHPDRNKDDPKANERFLELKDAYDKLLNPEYRRAYDRWGNDGTEWLETNSNISMNGALRILFTYATFASITFLITVASSDTNARSIALAGLGVIAGIEGSMRFNNYDFSMPFFPWLAVHQLVELLHRTYYTFVSGVIAFQSLTYVSENDQMLEALKIIVHQNQQIAHKLQTLDQELRITGKGGGFSKKGGASVQDPPSGSIDSTANLPRNLQAKIRNNQSSAPRRKAKIPSWVFMVGIYFFLNYISSG